ncbi:MAG: prephenate dehydrogenase/arogenate dehydrogenase family protein [Candidatus Moraniibacteriota bacterium]|jgi:prephenate dehydrogenase
MKPKIISIIGGNGKMGSKFAHEFHKRGFEVLIADADTKLTNEEVARIGDVIIVTVPIRDTEAVIKSIMPVVKKGSMVTDFTSVKIKPMDAMIQEVRDDIEIIGGHPLFGPTTDFKKQNFIICNEQGGSYTDWYINFLKSLGLNVLEMTKEEHDKNMAVIQCLTHFSALSLGSTLEKLHYNLEVGESIATPVYLMRLYGVGRILAQDADLYTDMQMYNPFAKEVAIKYKESVDELFQSVDISDENKFNKIFSKSKKYFGNMATRSMEITDKLIKTLS